MNQNKVQKIFQKFKQLNPNPTTELNYSNDFELLIAVILSAQATDISVNKVTPALFADAPTPKDIYQLGETKLKEYIKSIGLYNTKAENIIKTCKILVDNHYSKVPDNREELEKLPGVGRKTANVILNTAFDQATMAVDTHIFRVANRIGLACGKTPIQVEQQLLSNIPKTFLKDAHHWLILHGRYTCKARKPECHNCVILKECEFKEKNLETV